MNACKTTRDQLMQGAIYKQIMNDISIQKYYWGNVYFAEIKQSKIKRFSLSLILTGFCTVNNSTPYHWFVFVSIFNQVFLVCF